MKNKKIAAVDFDGVITDLDVSVSNYIRIRHGFHVVPESHLNDYHFSCLTKTIGESPLLEMFADPSFYDESVIAENSQEAMRLLAEEYKVYVVTARPHDLSQVTMDYLRRQGIAVEGVIYSRHKADQLRILEAAFFIDDSPHTVADVLSNLPDVDTYLRSAVYNKNADIHDHYRASSLYEAVVRHLGGC